MSDVYVFFRGLLFFSVGSVAALGGVLFGVIRGLFVWVALRAPGVVEAQPVGGGFHPVIRYTTAAGEEIVTHSSSFQWVDVGQEVTVLYRAASPYDVVVDAFLAIWGPPALVVALGTVFVVVGAGTVLGNRPVRVDGV